MHFLEMLEKTLPTAIDTLKQNNIININENIMLGKQPPHLHFAAKQGRSDIINALISTGENVHQKTPGVDPASLRR